MKKFSKLIALLTVAVFLFSLAGVASAADKESAAARLGALGIVEGDEGGLRLDDTITRAEFAKVAVMLAGMEDAAAVLAGAQPQFTDVKANAWYTGWINVAAAQGLIKGDGNGKFRPNDEITGAEVVTILLRVLGYNDNLPGNWPVDYIVKAAELGITKDASFVANAPAVRGDVFIMADAALSETVVSYNKDTGEFEKKVSDDEEVSLMVDKLSVTEVKGYVTDAPGLLGSTLEDNEVKVDNDKYEFVGDLDVDSLVGLEVTFFANDDGDLFAVKSTNADDVITDTIEKSEFSVSESVYQVTLKDADKTYDINSDALVIVNFAKEDLSALANDYAGADVKVILDEDDNVEAICINDWANIAAGIVKEVDAEDMEITYKDGFDGLTTDLSDEDYSVVVKGAVDSFADIAEFDLVYELNSETDYILYVVRDTVNGQVTKVSSDRSKVYIDGVKYTANLNAYSDDDGDKFNYKPANDARDFLGEDVTAYLDAQGKVFALAADIAPSNATTALAITDIVYETDAFGNKTYKVKLFTLEGVEAVYEFAKDTTKIGNTEVSNYTDSVLGKLVGFDLDENGKIKSMTVKSGEGTTIEPDSDDVEKYDRVDVSSTKYYVTDSTVVLVSDSGNNYDEPKIITWDDIKNAASNIGAVIYVSDNEVEYIVIASDVVSTSTADYAVFIESYYNADDKPVISVFENGAVVDYVYESYDPETGALQENDIITYKLSDGEISEATKQQPDSGTVADVDSSLSLVTVDINGTEVDYLVTADTMIVDNSGDAPVAADFADIKEDQTVIIKADDLVAEVIIITE